MKILNQCENKNFKKCDKNTYENLNNSERISLNNDNINYCMGDHCQIATYPSGLLLVKKSANEISLKFVNNNGEVLFDIKRDELVEMQNNIYDINALVCSSGVLVAYKYYYGEEYVYYTYNNAEIHAYTFDKIKDKIDKFEQNLGLYYNENKVAPKTKSALANYIEIVEDNCKE